LPRITLDLSFVREHKDRYDDIRSRHRQVDPVAQGCERESGCRPKTSLLSQALAVTLAEVVPNDPQERTYAQLVADTRVGIATTPGRLSVAAAAEIANRVEGRVHERIEFTDLTEQLSMRSDEELEYFLSNGQWPNEMAEPEGEREHVGEK